MAAPRAYSILFRCVVGGVAGLFFGILLKTNFEHAGPGILEILGAPAFRFSEWWHSLGFSTQAGATFADPFCAFFIQWTILGVIAGILSSFKRASLAPH